MSLHRDKRIDAVAEWFAGLAEHETPDIADRAYAENVVDVIEEADKPCAECNGKGYVTRSSHFDYGPNMSGSNHWSEPCPRGCQVWST